MRNGKDSDKNDQAISNWYDLVEIYSRRKLRYLDDRPPAMSGIAREFAKILRNGYIGGLWKSDLAIGLAWFPHLPRHPVTGVESGPSRSWASYEGGATWRGYMRSKLRVNQDFEILDHCIELMSPIDPFDKVKTAVLSVRGLLLPIHTPARDEYGNTRFKLEDILVTVVFEYPDDPRVQPDSELKLSLLVLVNVDWVGVEGIAVLQEEENRFSRVGWFDIEDVWPVTEDTRWVKMRDRTPRSQEELQSRLRSVWGGERNVRQFVLV